MSECPVERHPLDGPLFFVADVIAPIVGAVQPAVGAAVGAGAALLRETLARGVMRRRQHLYDMLAQSEAQVTAESATDERFAYAIAMLVDAVDRERSMDKVELFARLLAGHLRTARFEDIDEYDHARAVLADLEPREIYILVILHRFECAAASRRTEDRKNQGGYWSDFLDAVSREVGIPRDEIAGYLARLNRTGLYKTQTGALYGYGGDQGELTPSFERLRRVLQLDRWPLHADR